MYRVIAIAVLSIVGCVPSQSPEGRNVQAVKKTMTLEEQIKELSALGLNLNDGVTVDDLLYSFDRNEYESEPFELILFVLGIEVERAPWGVRCALVLGISTWNALSKQEITSELSNDCASLLASHNSLRKSKTL